MLYIKLIFIYYSLRFIKLEVSEKKLFHKNRPFEFSMKKLQSSRKLIDFIELILVKTY